MEPAVAEARGLRYLRVANDLRRGIVGDVYQDGERLPSQHQLARSHGVAFSTLGRVVALLESEGDISRKIRSAAFVHLPSGSKGKILIVDDEETIRRLFMRSLSNREWEVETAASGAEALERVEKQSYALIFLDLAMPGMNGAETLEAIRARNWDCPVVIITGYPDSALLAQILEIGPVTLLRKPFLQRNIREALQRYARPATQRGLGNRPQEDEGWR